MSKGRKTLFSVGPLALVLMLGCSSQTLPDTTDAGDNASDAAMVGGCRIGRPLAAAPCFSCAPLPADSHSVGCVAPLPALWGWDGSGIAPGVAYPLMCTVYLPVENPSYPGGPQPCNCVDISDGQGPKWICPI